MDSQYPKRQSVRLPGFDYAQAGAYFVTVCSYNKKCIFGHITDTHMHLNRLGALVVAAWKELPQMYTFISLDNWVLMPNHFHGIIWLNEKNPDQKSLSKIISAFKSISTSRARKAFDQGGSLWQRSFYEHIIRNQSDLLRIRQYIEDNAAQWAVDRENPDFNRTVQNEGL